MITSTIKSSSINCTSFLYTSRYINWNNLFQLGVTVITELVILGFPEISACEDSVDLSPSNPFLDICEKDKELEPALQVLQVRSNLSLLETYLHEIQ